MPACRTPTCPACFGPFSIPLSDIIVSPDVEYFRCSDCGCYWCASTGRNLPVTVITGGRSPRAERRISEPTVAKYG